MRRIFFCIACLSCFTLEAQRHQITVDGGLNKIFSFDDRPVLGGGSPWDNRFDATCRLTYAFYTQSDFYSEISVGYLNLRFLDDNVFAGMDGSDEVFINNHLTAQLGGGYKFDLSQKFELSVDVTGGLLYRFRAKSWTKGQSADETVRNKSWSEFNRHFGFSLNLSNYYRLFQRREGSLFLVASIRGLYVFDFAPLARDGENSDRLIPEIDLGIAFRFGDNRELF